MESFETQTLGLPLHKQLVPSETHISTYQYPSCVDVFEQVMIGSTEPHCIAYDSGYALLWKALTPERATNTDHQYSPL